MEERTIPISDRITVLPFSRQTEGDEVVIGRVETGQFLALPIEAVQILDELAGGATVGEAQQWYQRKFGEVPDIDDLLSILESRGFVRRGEVEETSEPVDAPRAVRRFHFTSISPAWAGRFFGKPILIFVSLTLGLALFAAAFDPSLLPGPRALYFPSHAGPALLILFAWGFVALFAHEMAHLVAARAVGVSARMGISHRLWVLVAETDLTGLWSVPRRKRYLPLLAGPLVDAFSFAVLVLILRAERSGWLFSSPALVAILRAVAFSYVLRLLWQCYLFVRTDFYYALITLLGCVNLMRNTEVFLRNRVARVLPWVRAIPEDALSHAEARAVRFYLPFYLGGRLLAFWSLFFISLPVAWLYFRSMGAALRNGYSHDSGAFLDSVVLASIVLLSTLAGLLLWIRSLLSRRSTPA